MIGGVFRFHHLVANLAAEFHGLSDVISLDAAEDGEEEEDGRAQAKPQQASPIARIVQIDGELRGRSGRVAFFLELSQPSAGQHQGEAEKQKARRHHIGEDAEVGISVRAGKKVEDEKKEKGEETAGRDDGSGETEPVAPDRLRVQAVGSVGHEVGAPYFFRERT